MVSLLVLVVSFLVVFFLVVVLSMYTAEAFDSTSCAPLAGDSERQIVTLAFLLLLLGNCVTVPKKRAGVQLVPKKLVPIFQFTCC